LDEEAAHLLASVPPEQWEENWWLVRCDGALIRGNHGGGVALMSELRLLRPLGRLLAALHLSPLIDAFDRFVARHRARWSWFVPKGSAPRRYP
jgi:hypothetical protein